MISGTVSDDLRPLVTLELIAPDGGRRTVVFEVDTAFTYAITLPPEMVTELGLVFVRGHVVEYADARTETVDVFEIGLYWDGHSITEEVFALGQRPLLGTRLLDCYDLYIRFLPGGDVLIRAVEDE